MGRLLPVFLSGCAYDAGSRAPDQVWQLLDGTSRSLRRSAYLSSRCGTIPATGQIYLAGFWSNAGQRYQSHPLVTGEAVRASHPIPEALRFLPYQ